MGAVALIFSIGVVDLILGYALAVYLGYGPANLWETWEAMTAQRPAGPQPAPATRLGDERGLAPSDESLANELEAGLAAGPLGKDSPEARASDAPEDWDLNDKYVETSLLRLNIAMMKSGARATDIDTRLRACRGHSDAETIRKCLADLKEDCRTYLAEQSAAADEFHSRIGELGELSALGDEIEMANLEQGAQIETTLSNLDHMDFESDLETANRRLLEEVRNLRVARHRLRDSQEAAFLAIAAFQNHMGQIDQRLHLDPLTKLPNRIGLEATLWQWWQQGRHRSTQISAALFDVDDFNQINDEHGPLAGDRILYNLARVVEARAGKADLAGRFAGQRFLVMMVVVGPRTAIKNAELVRQSVQRVTFMHGPQEIHVTVRAGITEVNEQDTADSLFERLEETLKQAGRNRALFHTGKGLEPIESPNLGAEYKEIAI